MSLFIGESPASSVLSLDLGIPFDNSEYLEKSAPFDLPSDIPIPGYIPIYTLKDSSVASSDSSNVDPPALWLLSASFAENMRKWLSRIRNTIASESSEANERKATLDFESGLQAINKDHSPLPFPIAGTSRCVSKIGAGASSELDGALEDAISGSLIVEGFNEEREPPLDYINVSLRHQKKEDGTEEKVIFIQDLEVLEGKRGLVEHLHQRDASVLII